VTRFPADCDWTLAVGGREEPARFVWDASEDLWLVVGGERLGPECWESLLEERASVEGGRFACSRPFRTSSGETLVARIEVSFRRAESNPRAFDYTCTLSLEGERFVSRRDRHVDAAVLHAAELARARGALVSCLTCQWSSYEPSAGWGSLECFARSGQAYLDAAGSPDPRVRKWGFRDLPAVVEPDAPSMPARIPEGAPPALVALRWRGKCPTEELHACEVFENAAPGFGYK
jgi:hypothetical protein